MIFSLRISLISPISFGVFTGEPSTNNRLKRSIYRERISWSAMTVRRDSERCCRLPMLAPTRAQAISAVQGCQKVIGSGLVGCRGARHVEHDNLLFASFALFV